MPPSITCLKANINDKQSVPEFLQEIFESFPVDSDAFQTAVICTEFIIRHNLGGTWNAERTVNRLMKAFSESFDSTKQQSIAYVLYKLLTNREDWQRLDFVNFFKGILTTVEVSQENLGSFDIAFSAISYLFVYDKSHSELLAEREVVNTFSKLIRFFSGQAANRSTELFLSTLDEIISVEGMVECLVNSDFMQNYANFLELLDEPCSYHYLPLNSILSYCPETSLKPFFSVLLRDIGYDTVQALICDIIQAAQDCDLLELAELNLIQIMLTCLSKVKVTSWYTSSFLIICRLLELGTPEKDPHFDEFNRFALRVAELDGVRVLKVIHMQVCFFNHRPLPEGKKAISHFGEEFENYMIKRRGNATKNARS